MVERTEVALAGNPRLVTFSESGRLIGVGGYDGRAVVIDAGTGKTVCKHVVQARKNDLPILHHRFSDDDRYYGFSCASRVIVLDIEAGQAKKEIAISTAEASTAVPFAFDGGASLIMADAGTITRHALDAPEHEVLFKIERGGSSTALELDPAAQLIANKCTGERWSANGAALRSEAASAARNRATLRVRARAANVQREAALSRVRHTCRAQEEPRALTSTRRPRAKSRRSAGAIWGFARYFRSRNHS